MATNSSQPIKTSEGKRPKEQKLAEPQLKRLNAWQSRDWETLFVTFIVFISLLATLWMVLISITDPEPNNRFRIVPAAAIMVMVELWLMVYLPVYGKLAFWGAFISLATYLFFAVPFIALGLLPTALATGGTIATALALICCLLLFRQRDHFLS